MCACEWLVHSSVCEWVRWSVSFVVLNTISVYQRSVVLVTLHSKHIFACSVQWWLRWRVSETRNKQSLTRSNDTPYTYTPILLRAHGISKRRIWSVFLLNLFFFSSLSVEHFLCFYVRYFIIRVFDSFIQIEFTRCFLAVFVIVWICIVFIRFFTDSPYVFSYLVSFVPVSFVVFTIRGPFRYYLIT